jgi:hypothetical protein
VLHRGKVVFAGRLDAMRAGAPDPVWRLRTSDDVAALDAARGVTGVKAAGHDDGGLVVYAAQDSMDGYVVHLSGQGVAVRGLELDVTPLESLLFELTGESAQAAEPGRPAEPEAGESRPRWRRPTTREDS